MASTPSNGWIVWASNRNDARHEIFLMKSDGSGVTRLTKNGAKYPSWSSDGRWISYAKIPENRTRVMRWDGSEDKEIFNGWPAFWMHDGSGVVCMSGDDGYLVDPDNGQSQLLFRKSDFSKMAGMGWDPSGITADGRWLVTWSDRYRNGYDGNNGQFNSYNSAIILDFQNKSGAWFFGPGCEPTTPPSGDWIYHVNATEKDIYRMKLGDIQSRSSYEAEIGYPDADWGHQYFPRISTDGLWLTYGATTGCHDHDTCDYEIFVHRLNSGNDDRTRLTFDSNNDQWAHMYVGELWAGSKPKLSLSPGSLSFGAVKDGTNPAAKTVAVSNLGGGTLSDVIASKNESWLIVTRSGSGNSQTLTNEVNLSGLAAGTHEATVQVSSSNASNSPQSYNVVLTISDEAKLDRIELVAERPTILAGEPTTVAATLKDQNGEPFAAVLSWSVSGGGVMSPALSPAAASQHNSIFESDGTGGTFTVTAEAEGVEGTVSIRVSTLALPLRVNCGSNEFDLEGWERDDAFATGGHDWVNQNVVETAGVLNAAPPDVYRSVRHGEPHSYGFELPDGHYTLRLHFADAYQGRSMNYFVEGEQILKDFDIASEAGGVNKALVKEFQVAVSDGDGMKIEVSGGALDDDVFEAGIEVMRAERKLAAVEVSLAMRQILPAATVETTARLFDQFGNPFAAEIRWSVAGGGSMAPESSGTAASEHASTFSSDGTTGNFVVAAEAGGERGTAEITVLDSPDDGPGTVLMGGCGTAAPASGSRTSVLVLLAAMGFLWRRREAPRIAFGTRVR